MSNLHKSTEDTSIKVSKEAMKALEGKARVFESKKEVLERVIMQSCSPSKTPGIEPEQTESEDTNES